MPYLNATNTLNHLFQVSFHYSIITIALKGKPFVGRFKNNLSFSRILCSPVPSHRISLAKCSYFYSLNVVSRVKRLPLIRSGSLNTLALSPHNFSVSRNYTVCYNHTIIGNLHETEARKLLQRDRFTTRNNKTVRLLVAASVIRSRNRLHTFLFLSRSHGPPVRPPLKIGHQCHTRKIYVSVRVDLFAR